AGAVVPAAVAWPLLLLSTAPPLPVPSASIPLTAAFFADPFLTAPSFAASFRRTRTSSGRPGGCWGSACGDWGEVTGSTVGGHRRAANASDLYGISSSGPGTRRLLAAFI